MMGIKKIIICFSLITLLVISTAYLMLHITPQDPPSCQSCKYRCGGLDAYNILSCIHHSELESKCNIANYSAG